jgi:hypothetical protein
MSPEAIRLLILFADTRPDYNHKSSFHAQNPEVKELMEAGFIELAPIEHGNSAEWFVFTDAGVRGIPLLKSGKNYATET